MNCISNPFGAIYRSCRRFLCRFIGQHIIMALFQDLSDAIKALDDKVTAHLDVDGKAVADMVAANQVLQDEKTALAAQLAAAEANGLTDEEKAAVLAQLGAVSARL